MSYYIRFDSDYVRSLADVVASGDAILHDVMLLMIDIGTYYRDTPAKMPEMDILMRYIAGTVKQFLILHETVEKLSNGMRRIAEQFDERANFSNEVLASTSARFKEDFGYADTSGNNLLVTYVPEPPDDQVVEDVYLNESTENNKNFFVQIVDYVVNWFTGLFTNK